MPFARSFSSVAMNLFYSLLFSSLLSLVVSKFKSFLNSECSLIDCILNGGRGGFFEAIPWLKAVFSSLCLVTEIGLPIFSLMTSLDYGVVQ